MRERPILLNAEMVRAVLDGTKTQTRRVVKIQPPASCKRVYAPYSADSRAFVGLNDWSYQIWHSNSPFGQVGDRLWVRETFGVADRWLFGGEPTDPPRCIAYSADHAARCFDPEYDVNTSDWGWENMKWTPSIHMPRWASRITLEITAVRVERLKDISEEDAESEGIEGISRPTGGDDYQDYWRNYSLTKKQADGWPWFTGDRIASFKSLWESIYGTWDANPWVWVIEFKVVQP